MSIVYSKPLIFKIISSDKQKIENVFRLNHPPPPHKSLTNEPEAELQDEEGAGEEDPEPNPGAVEDEQHPEGEGEQVREVEHLKT